MKRVKRNFCKPRIRPGDCPSDKTIKIIAQRETLPVLGSGGQELPILWVNVSSPPASPPRTNSESNWRASTSASISPSCVLLAARLHRTSTNSKRLEPATWNLPAYFLPSTVTETSNHSDARASFTAAPPAFFCDLATQDPLFNEPGRMPRR